MTDWYPYEEETKTLDFRWYCKGNDPDNRKLQQKIVIRKGFGSEAKITQEWREIDTLTDIDMP